MTDSYGHYNSIIDKSFDKNITLFGMPYLGIMDEESDIAKDCEFLEIAILTNNKIGFAAVRITDCKNNVLFLKEKSYLFLRYTSIIDELLRDLAYNSSYEYALAGIQFEETAEPIVQTNLDNKTTTKVNVYDNLIDLSDTITSTKNEVKNLKSEENISIVPTISIEENRYRFALIIGNQDYTTYKKTVGKQMEVEYAINDASLFRDYAHVVFGIPEKNIIYCENATAFSMFQEIDKVEKLLNITKGKGELFFYYSGHGYTDSKGDPHLIPCDVVGNNLEYCISLNEVLRRFGETNCSIFSFIDACYSGGGRSEDLVAHRSLSIEPNSSYLPGNILLFASSTGSQPSTAYHQKEHGIFTYFLLKGLKQFSKNMTFGQLADLIYEEVSINSLLINNQEQNPVVKSSPNLEEVWRSIKL